MRQWPHSRTLALLIAASLLSASGCATTASLDFPPSADLRPRQQPNPDPARLEREVEAGGGDAYLDRVDNARDDWGQAAHDAQVRLCKFFKDKGMKVDCEPLPAPPVE